MDRRPFLTALLLVAAKAAGALEPDEILITYTMKRGGQQISAVSHELEWNFLLIDEHRARMQVRVPVHSFDSGDADFDSALRKAIGSAEHPLRRSTESPGTGVSTARWSWPASSGRSRCSSTPSALGAALPPSRHSRSISAITPST